MKHRIEQKIDTQAYSTKWKVFKMNVSKYCKYYNVVMPKIEFVKARSCEYYLHFNVKLPYPEK